MSCADANFFFKIITNTYPFLMQIVKHIDPVVSRKIVLYNLYTFISFIQHMTFTRHKYFHNIVIKLIKKYFIFNIVFIYYIIYKKLYIIFVF